MEAATKADWPAAVLIGSPSYFQHIGFVAVPAGTLKFPGPQDPKRVMIAPLAGSHLNYSGTIRAGYHKSGGQ